MNRGSDGGFRPAYGHHKASMRPRFMNRGSALGTLGGGDRVRASMRPRFMNRGSENALGGLTATLTALQ